MSKSNFCIDTTIQFFSDQGSLKPIGHNIRVTKSSWDPDNSGSLGWKGLPLLFIGDYFGLALTNATAYVFFPANYDLGNNPTQDLQMFVGRIGLMKLTSNPSNTTVVETIIPIIAVMAVIILVTFYLIRRTQRRLRNPN